jgi:hypothetical protein
MRSHLDQYFASHRGPAARTVVGLSMAPDDTTAFADPDKAIVLLARAFSDPLRLAIVRELAPYKRVLSDEEIADALDVRRTLVRVHVNVLLDLGVLEHTGKHPTHGEDPGFRLAAAARRELVWRRVLADSWSAGDRNA